MIRLLLKRNLLSRRMFLILLAGLFLIYIDLDKYFMYGHVYPACVYTLGMQEFGYANTYYCFFFVFFATYIGSKIFVEDYKNNAISVQLMRITRKKYMLNCGIASFLSGGIAVIQAIMEEQKLILLDEPTNALDKKSVKKFKEIILKLKKEGKTIIIVSHQESVINDIADIILEFEFGKLIDVREV